MSKHWLTKKKFEDRVTDWCLWVVLPIWMYTKETPEKSVQILGVLATILILPITLMLGLPILILLLLVMLNEDFGQG